MSRCAISMIRYLSLVLPLALIGGAGTVAAPTNSLKERPQRIVSLNPCVDAILLEVADPNQITAISHYSHDPRSTSSSLTQARRFKAISGTAEEVLALRPDMVIAGPHVALPTVHALERLGIELKTVGVADSVEASQQQIIELAKAVGAPDRGKKLVAQMDIALDAAKPRDGQKIPALIWQGGGLVPGAETLSDALLKHTGFENLSSVYGLKKWDVLLLEKLVSRPPKVLFTDSGPQGTTDRMLSHPVVKKLGKRIEVVKYPVRMMHCAGPTIIEAVGKLAAARRKVEEGQ